MKHPALIVPGLSLFLAVGPTHAGVAYDPLAVPERPAATSVDLTVHDAARSRDIPVRVWLPATNGPAPVVLFSHGLGGSNEGYGYLDHHWSARGYVVVRIQHPGSDAEVWQQVPVRERLASMRAAISVSNYLLRVQDVPAVLDQLTRWNQATGNVLFARLDLARVGMSGHSFGAITTQGVSGQCARDGRPLFTDPRIRAAVLMSPSCNDRLVDPRVSFGQVKVPWLLMTGTHDVVEALGDAVATMSSRLAVYPALPPGGKYELFLADAEHWAFGDYPWPGADRRRNPNHYRAILATSTAFWDAWLRGDAAAQAWLDGDGPRRVLEPQDRWQHK